MNQRKCYPVLYFVRNRLATEIFGAARLNYTAENGYPDLTWFERDPNLDKLRKDPRFIEFLDKLRPRFERLKALAQTPISESK